MNERVGDWDIKDVEDWDAHLRWVEDTKKNNLENTAKNDQYMAKMEELYLKNSRHHLFKKYEDEATLWGGMSSIKFVYDMASNTSKRMLEDGYDPYKFVFKVPDIEQMIEGWYRDRAKNRATRIAADKLYYQSGT